MTSFNNDLQHIWWLIIGMSVVTSACRLLPLFILGRWQPQGFFKTALKYVPVAVLGAMILPAVLLADDSQGQSYVLFNRAEFFALIPTIAIAYFFRNIGYTVVSGVFVIAALRFLAF